MARLTRELGVDLGTTNTVFVEGRQILLQEPTAVAIDIEEQKMVEWGQAAKDDGRVGFRKLWRLCVHYNMVMIAEYEITEKC